MDTVLSLREIEKLKTQYQQRKSQSLRPIHFAADLLIQSKGTNISDKEKCIAMEYINDQANQTEEAIDSPSIITELGNFMTADGIFKHKFIIKASKTVKLLVFWKVFCSKSVLLQIAERILSMPSTSATVERSFSSQSFIYTNRRNRLTTERSVKLNYIRYNTMLLQIVQTDKEKIRCETANTSKDTNQTVGVTEEIKTNRLHLDYEKKHTSDSETTEESWHSSLLEDSDNDIDLAKSPSLDEEYEANNSKTGSLLPSSLPIDLVNTVNNDFFL
ncbi:hypothetical protein NQ314_007386 [Rhamnusium bicolor]|uniref:HAT C-terminal dimerisation domain-containing protein n=1 Tax=Rhamnusium bicolor TaxID=1586634 RepID=A0AAV8YQM6_9CUCU|nr:hypothetical protein NQ314_007386 [Rhamnusium bicolor]